MKVTSRSKVILPTNETEILAKLERLEARVSTLEGLLKSYQEV